MRFFSLMIVLICAGFLVACNKVVLLQDLDQKNTNEILVVLSKNGIRASKKTVEKQQQVTWTIEVSASEEQQSREILVANYLPKQRALGLEGICKDAGMIPTPKTEKCREMLALKGEIVNSLESISGVVNADVVINVPEKEDFPSENTPLKRPTASVVLQVNKEKAEMITESKIQQFVANAVTGMDLRDVTVIISQVAPTTIQETIAPISATEPSQTEPSSQTDGMENSQEDLISVGGFSMDGASAKKFKLLIFLGVLLFMVVMSLLVLALVKLVRVRGKAQIPNPNNPALPERARMDQLVEETGRKA